jgi:WD40 repeat protein
MPSAFPHTGTLNRPQVLCCAPLDPHTLLTCSSDGTVQLIDLRQHPPSAPPPHTTRTVPQSLGGGPVDSSHVTQRRPLVKMAEQVYAVDWNRTNGMEFVAASGWGDLRVYDIRRGDLQHADACRLCFKGECDGEVTGCSWSKDGRRLVGSWLGGSAYTFDVQSGEVVSPHSARASMSKRRIPKTRFLSLLHTCPNERASHAARRELENFYNEIGRQQYVDRCMPLNHLSRQHLDARELQVACRSHQRRCRFISKQLIRLRF